MPQRSLQGMFGSDVDPLDLMRAEDDGMLSATVALMDRTFEALADHKPTMERSRIEAQVVLEVRAHLTAFENLALTDAQITRSHHTYRTIPNSLAETLQRQIAARAEGDPS